MRQVISLFSKV